MYEYVGDWLIDGMSQWLCTLQRFTIIPSAVLTVLLLPVISFAVHLNKASLWRLLNFSLIYLYRQVHLQCIQVDRYTLSYLECWCKRLAGYNLRCLLHTRPYLCQHTCRSKDDLRYNYFNVRLQELISRWDTRTWRDVSSYMVVHLPLNYDTCTPKYFWSNA